MAFFLQHSHLCINPQQAIDGPLVYTAHLQASFYPHGTRPGTMLIEPQFPADILEKLRARGHRLEATSPLGVGCLSADSPDPEGLLRVSATRYTTWSGLSALSMQTHPFPKSGPLQEANFKVKRYPQVPQVEERRIHRYDAF